MKLRPEQAEVLEEFLSTPDSGWMLLTALLNERLSNYQRALKSGRLDHDEYVRTCAAIRELEYLRDEPQRLVRKSYVENKSGY